MAAVIHSLWERGDRSPLILPSTIPVDDPRVQFELTRYLSENWAPVIEKDVDGPNSLPARLDAEGHNLGKYHACRRVARTIYLGSAPIQRAAHQGIEDRRVRLGCVAPGESPQIFGDALRRLAGEATYLYQDGVRYWYAPQPNVTSLAEERAEQLRREPEKVAREVERRVREKVRRSGAFSRVHAFPQSPQDVPDDLDARLVVLGLDRTHARGEDSPALQEAKRILESRGTAPRMYRNTLVFLAPDRTRVQDLDEAVRRYLAWDSILRDRETLDLTPHQARQAEQQRNTSDATVMARLPETFFWLLVPVQPDPKGEETWQEIKLQGNDGLAERASRKLLQEELLVATLGGVRLRQELDQIPLWRGDHVAVPQLVEDFARYVYLPRLRDPSVLMNAVADGVALLTWEQDSFAYAEGYDEATGRYQGLRVAQQVRLLPEAPQGILVKPEVASRQLQKEGVLPGPGPTPPDGENTDREHQGDGPKPMPPKPVLRRFYGTVALDPVRAGADAGRVQQEVVAHLAGLPGAQVRVTLEIEAEVPFPHEVPEQVVRVVSENCRTLKFTNHRFEEE
jgi:hypothetical protein